MQATYWIKLYNTLLDWEWKTDPKMVALWVHILLCANNEDGKFMGKEVSRGQFVTSLEHISRDTGLSVMNVRTCLERLKKSKCITTKSTNRSTCITICNYDNYQNKKNATNKQTTNNQQTTNTQPTDNQQTNNKQLTTIIDIKNKEKENKEILTTNKQQEKGFENWLKCKEYLTANGRTATDQGFERFYIINQEGTTETPPYWYKDGVLDSFDNFMARPSNRKRYTPKGEGKGKGNAPQIAPGSPKKLTVADFNIHISNIMKQPLDQVQREDLLSLRYAEQTNNKGELIITASKDSWDRLLKSTLKSVIAAEFRGYRLAPTSI